MTTTTLPPWECRSCGFQVTVTMKPVDLWKNRIVLVNMNGTDHNCPRRADVMRARTFRSIRRAEEREKELDMTPLQKVFADLMRQLRPVVVVEEEHDGFGTAE